MANLDEPVPIMPRRANFRIYRTKTPLDILHVLKLIRVAISGSTFRTLCLIVGQLLEMPRFSLFEIIKSNGNRCDKKLVVIIREEIRNSAKGIYFCSTWKERNA